ncbi:MAG: GGDEF domain-containing protein [Campylobacterota bacterium]|nr:GGDEF domain-containing protein [Campylobacterota bacterium]
MKSRKKISIRLSAVMLSMLVLMIGLFGYGMKTMGIKDAQDKAEMAANIVKMGLTTQMLHGTMDKRGDFISQVEAMDNMEKIWLIRGELIDKQYGEGKQNEQARDEIDLEVLKNGEQKVNYVDDLFADATYRVTIPYRAEEIGAINCIQCHEAKVGDTLGAISLVIDMNNTKTQSLNIIMYTSIIAFFLIIFINIFFNRLMGPYMAIFDSIKDVMSKAEKGDYSHRISDESISGEAKEVSKWINTLLVKLQSTLIEIDSKVQIFLAKDINKDLDPLIEVKSTVTRLSNVYLFRQAIEHDEHLEDVYSRLVTVLRNEFKLDNFNLIEMDTITKKVEIIHIEKELICDVKQGCRADRTSSTVDSCYYKDLCNRVTTLENNYICIPYTISNEFDIVLSIITNDKNECVDVHKNIPLIQDYIDAAKPEIVSKKMTQILEMSARTDALTGLYNRKYLEESINRIIKEEQRLNISYGILLADIDHFKMINDNLGHDVGDEALRVIATTMQENVRDSDMVIRYGGEEFIILLYNCDQSYLEKIAENIRVSFSKKKIKAGGGESFSKTISIGGAMYPNDSDSFWKVIKYSDIAMYHAKNNGRNQIKIIDKQMKEDADLDDVY